MLINLDKREFLSEDEWNRSRTLDQALEPNWFLGALAYLLGLGDAPQGSLFGRWRGDSLVLTGENAEPLKYYRGQDILLALEVPHHQTDNGKLPDITHLAAERFTELSGPVTRELFEQRAYRAALGSDLDRNYGARALLHAFKKEGDESLPRPAFGNTGSDGLRGAELERAVERANDAHLLTQLELLEKHRPEALTPLARVELRRLRMEANDA